MMPDLGKYFFTVLAAWGVTFALVTALVVITLVQARRARAALAAREGEGRS